MTIVDYIQDKFSKFSVYLFQTIDPSAVKLKYVLIGVYDDNTDLRNKVAFVLSSFQKEDEVEDDYKEVLQEIVKSCSTAEHFTPAKDREDFMIKNHTT